MKGSGPDWRMLASYRAASHLSALPLRVFVLTLESYARCMLQAMRQCTARR